MTANQGPELIKHPLDPMARNALNHYSERWEHIQADKNLIPLNVPFTRIQILHLLVRAARGEVDSDVVTEE